MLGAATEAAGGEGMADTETLAITPSRDCSKMREKLLGLAKQERDV